MMGVPDVCYDSCMDELPHFETILTVIIPLATMGLESVAQRGRCRSITALGNPTTVFSGIGHAK